MDPWEEHQGSHHDVVKHCIGPALIKGPTYIKVYPVGVLIVN